MNRTTRWIVVLVVALAAAAAASVGVFRVLAGMPVKEVEVKSVEAIVAARNIPVGTLVTKDDVKSVPWPERAQVAGAFTSIDAAVNRGAIVAIAENEPLTETKLAPVGAGAGLTPTIPSGMRAISVKTNEVIGVAGFVVPGTRVDVLVTISRQGQQAEESMSRIVLSNVQVLTAGTRFDQEQSQQDGKPIPTSVVTLLVTPEDAEKMALASEEGQIMLTLRNPLDVRPTETSGVRMAALMRDPSTPVEQKVEPRRVVATVKPAETPPPPPAPKIYTVEAIRAAKRTEESIK